MATGKYENYNIMDLNTKVDDTHTGSDTQTAVTGTDDQPAPHEHNYYSLSDVAKWTKKLLDAKTLKQSTVTVFGMPRLVRPPFHEYYSVSRYYGPAKCVPLIYRAEEMFPSSEGIPQI
ncbi:unnamed protein product [Macrosiphum euphorbiae]|uniref:Uncharacterized protein n=1 Tax=Macrosiphum euphorbiae TaxID=13131 RepID=A0AAV0WPC4_9HEMI|nr:unnamed protein product [Macrosiphum euphorbiae]